MARSLEGCYPWEDDWDTDPVDTRDGLTYLRTLDALERASGQNQPFFIAAGLQHPHTPYCIPKSFWDIYDPATIALSPAPLRPADTTFTYGKLENASDLAGFDDSRGGSVRNYGMPEWLERKLRHGYFASVSYVDYILGQWLDKLEELDMLDNTIIVLWGDHGYHLHDHGVWSKQTNYEFATRAPLYVYVPDRTEGSRQTNAIVEFVDIYPTLLELCGFEIPDRLQALSMMPLLENPNQKWKKAAVSQWRRAGHMGYAFRTEDFRYIRWYSEKDATMVFEELYDERDNLYEQENLAKRNIINLYWKNMQKWLKRILPMNVAGNFLNRNSIITHVTPINSDMKKRLYIYFLFVPFVTFSQPTLQIPLQQGEKIWSGAIKEGHKMPFEPGYSFDFYANNNWNQLQPVLLSNQGLVVWSEEPYRFTVTDAALIIDKNLGEVQHLRSEQNTLAGAARLAAEKFYPPSGKLPALSLFEKPQYNTWIELTYNQNQEDILKYARAIIANGLEPGVLMIDDTWQEDYGLWRFHPGRFPNPKAMMAELHEMGFEVMLWICPFVSADQWQLVQPLIRDKVVLMNKDKEHTTWENATNPAIIQWWNGYSALLDFTNPKAVTWFNNELDRLVKEFGVDGFKFDAGDMHFYPEYALSMEAATPNRHSERYAQFAFRFPLNEYRACWKLGNQPIAQRLHDKNHTWQDLGLLIPHMLTEGLVGYTFSCPDMIGGGNYISFLDIDTYEQDIVVRSAQCHALMPMMQFSVAPWRILDKENFDAIKKALEIRKRFTPKIMELTAHSARTGEPIIRSMAYQFPGQGYEYIDDQFMLGQEVLVAPVTTPDSTRMVVLPKGKWLSDEGKSYKGNRQITIDVPISRLPYFIKQ
ncbi:MAG: sulfatase-like hydrolase/transferase [Cyclobacteriaceae bacterium]|nr:sulfatase-like hydrolase/transferase [Cyclobacteriaceae bacterium]